jgi:hypothetical protein
MKKWYALLCVLCFAGLTQAFGQAQLKPAVSPGNVVVHTQFGGQIFGFDVDANGREGVLTESGASGDGSFLAAVETFDQTTGKITRVVSQTEGQDDFVTMGVFNSIGLIEREHVVRLFDVRRKFVIMNPLDANRFTGEWTPPIDQNHVVRKVSGVLGSSDSAVYVLDTSGSFTPLVFRSNVGANIFGPISQITDQDFTSPSLSPAFAYDNRGNRAILGHAMLGNPFVPGFIATVDLATGAFSKFRGVGLGDVNGLSVDPETGTVCTTTEIDFSVEFYNLATRSGFGKPLPGAVNQFYSGADAEWDPVNRLFLVAQPNSSTAASGSSIHVYDVAGNLIESLNGFSFSNAFNVIPAHIALKPSNRSGFVDGPDPGVSEIQSFTY